jgi:hypothetical protein
MGNEARLAFWAAAYLIQLHRVGITSEAALVADEALMDFDDKTQELLPDADQKPT